MTPDKFGSREIAQRTYTPGDPFYQIAAPLADYSRDYPHEDWHSDEEAPVPNATLFVVVVAALAAAGAIVWGVAKVALAVMQ